MDIRFAVNSYRSDSLPVSAQRLVNAYAELQPKDARTPVSVHGFPGIATWTTAGNGPIRGLFEMHGVVYCVSGSEFYSIDSDGVATLVGTGITQNNVVSMAGNDLEVLVVNGTANGWGYVVASDSFAQIADADFNSCATVTFIDGYFVFDWLNTNKFFHSGLLDGTAYDALDFASAESSHDRVLSVLNNQGILLIFGEKTLEVWNHTGAQDFVFQRYDGHIPERGILAALARAIIDNSTFFLGNDRVFYRLNGLRPVRLSTHAIEKEWEGYATVSDAFCFPVEYGGHKFVYVTFPTESKTWGFDVASGLWHERLSWDPNGIEVKWRANCALKAFSKTLIGDANSNKIGYLDKATHTEFGDPIRTILTAPPIHRNGRMGFMPKFEATFETGVGATTGQGSDPQVMLDWSDDGGETWGPEFWQTLGAKGVRNTRVQWDRLGSFYQRTLRLQISDPVKRVLLSARCPGLHFEDDY